MHRFNFPGVPTDYYTTTTSHTGDTQHHAVRAQVEALADHNSKQLMDFVDTGAAPLEIAAFETDQRFAVTRFFINEPQGAILAIDAMRAAVNAERLAEAEKRVDAARRRAAEHTQTDRAPVATPQHSPKPQRPPVPMPEIAKSNRDPEDQPTGGEMLKGLCGIAVLAAIGYFAFR